MRVKHYPEAWYGVWYGAQALLVFPVSNNSYITPDEDCPSALAVTYIAEPLS